MSQTSTLIGKPSLNSKEYLLKEEVILEPLMNHWFAWTLLLAPTTGSLILKNHHIRLLESYLRAPHLHHQASKEGRLRGGMFLSVDFNEIKAQQMLELCKKQQVNLISLAEGITTLEKMIKEKGDGHSLETLYEKIPENLKGYVELSYDLNNQPSVRYIEPLLYKSKYYDVAQQQIILSLCQNDHRPFCLSNPRIPNDEELLFNLPFESPLIDTLFEMKSKPHCLEEITEIYPFNTLETEKKIKFLNFFKEATPQRTENKEFKEEIRIRYFGHATILIETGGVSILTDPIVGYPLPEGIPRFSFSDLPASIDYVLLTHNHQDHIVLETLLQLRHKIKTIIVPKNSGGFLHDPSIKWALKSTGFKNVQELGELDTLEIPDGVITGLPFLGEHGDLSIASKLGYHVRLKNYSIACLADSNNLDPWMYHHLANEFLGDIDVLFIGMECSGAPMSWLYGPLLVNSLTRKMDESRRLNGSNANSAIKVVEVLNPKQVYVYAMGAEPWLSFLSSIEYASDSVPIVESDKLINVCKEKGIRSERLFGKKEIYI